MPEENYWYQRHLIVYEWIRDRVAGLKVIDMACGEGYGSSVLSGRKVRGSSSVMICTSSTNTKYMPSL